ncbi:hypothetical protein [Elstera cyanobacteriorum]|uniref:hypothetical protein n=1 Tax=Elstera cyanobacteriorum TaxID=2022747 RepID=UPI002353DFA6|nr:hypothetical protein [Elstera cyanobacteriorum]MCK6442313.1 hypothetical protein [Elstera cyanobacteriorum]
MDAQELPDDVLWPALQAAYAELVREKAIQAFRRAISAYAPLKRWKIANADEFTDDVEYFVTKPMTRADAEKRGKVIGEAD